MFISYYIKVMQVVDLTQSTEPQRTELYRDIWWSVETTILDVPKKMLLHFISFHFKQFIHIDPVDQRQYLEDDADEPSSVWLCTFCSPVLGIITSHGPLARQQPTATSTTLRLFTWSLKCKSPFLMGIEWYRSTNVPYVHPCSIAMPNFTGGYMEGYWRFPKIWVPLNHLNHPF